MAGKKLTQEQWINKANEAHSFKYDYSFVEYINARTKVCIICPKHGEFWQIASDHLKPRGCPKCVSSKQPLQLTDFINRANKVHNFSYDYSKVKFNISKDEIEIICPKHGSFLQRAGSHLSGNGCPKCRISKNENKIKDWLIINNIKFEEQKIFKECLGVRNHKLKFDFYLPDYNLCIEYDGEQHFIPVKFNNKSKEKAIKDLVRTKERDSIKSKYCLDNNIKLIRIPYWKQNNIEEILRGIL